MRDRDVVYDFNELDELQPAYAMTIHKSQGSEYPVVVMPIHTQHFMMLSEKSALHGDHTGKGSLSCWSAPRRPSPIAVKKTESRQADHNAEAAFGGGSRFEPMANPSALRSCWPGVFRSISSRELLEYAHMAAPLKADNISNDVINIVRATLPGEWRQVHAEPFSNEPGSRQPGTQKAGQVHLFGTDVMQPGDRFYAVIQYQVRENTVSPKLHMPGENKAPNLSLDEWSGKKPLTPKQRKALKDAEEARKTRADEYTSQLDASWRRPVEAVNTYDAKAGHVLLQFAVFLSGWKPGMDPIIYKPDEWY